MTDMPALPETLTVESLLPIATFLLTGSKEEIDAWKRDTAFEEWASEHSDALLGSFGRYKNQSALVAAVYAEAKRLLERGSK